MNKDNQSWILIGITLILVYRMLLALLLEAMRSITFLQRRLLIEEGVIKDSALTKLLSNPQSLIISISIWNNLLLVLALGLSCSLNINLFQREWILAGIALLYIISLDVLIPTVLISNNSSIWVRRLFPFYRIVHPLLAPMVRIITKIIDYKRKHNDIVREELSEEVVDEGVSALLEEGQAEGIIEEGDRELIKNVVEFGDTVVREVMTPRTLIHALPISSSIEDVWKAFRDGRRSRIPIYHETIDNILGILLLKDLIQVNPKDVFNLEELVKPTCFVPESKQILQLLRDLQRTNTQLAMVVDEYGNLSGLVSMEDLLEEVFGEIRDEHELQADIQELSKDEFLVSGHVHVDDLEEKIGLECHRDGFDTLAGLIMSTIGHVPITQEVIKISGANLTVQRMDGMRILQVHVQIVNKQNRKIK